MSSVAPAVGRKFKAREIYDHLDPDSRYLIPRFKAEILLEDGYVIGEASWWIPVIGHARIDGYPIDSADGITTWKRHLTVGNPVPPDDASLIAQISNMVMFDFLINNPDRWSGGNARISEDRSVLYFMDNTLSFGDDHDGHPKARAHLERCQKFSISLIEGLRGVSVDDLRATMSVDVAPFDDLLSDDEIQSLIARRDHALAYVDALIEEHGVDAVLVFP